VRCTFAYHNSVKKKTEKRKQASDDTFLKYSKVLYHTSANKDSEFLFYDKMLLRKQDGGETKGGGGVISCSYV